MERMQTAIKAMLELDRRGHPLSVREIAEYYKVPKTSLHRWYTKAKKNSGKSSQSSGKHCIEYLLSSDTRKE